MLDYQNTKTFLQKTIEHRADWSEEVFIFKKVKNTVLWTYFVSELNDEEIVGMFYEEELEKSKSEFRIEIEIKKKKHDKLFVK